MSTRSNFGLGDEHESSGEAATATLLTSLMSRRTLLKRASVTGGVALSAGGIFSALAAEGAYAGQSLSVLAEPDDVTPFNEIFKIAETAEQLAITFYSNGVANAGALGLSATELASIKAAGIEEQIHHNFFASITGVDPIQPTTFSFPAGSKTFTDLATFIFTQQVLEFVFDSAFLAAVRELSHLRAHRAAQIAAQIACIESEHRVLGRAILVDHGITSMTTPKAPVTGVLNPPPNPPPGPTIPTVPANNLVFAPVFIEAVKDAPALVAKAGFLSPVAGNTYSYTPIDPTSSTYSTVFDGIYFRDPTINLGDEPINNPGHGHDHGDDRDRHYRR